MSRFIVNGLVLLVFSTPGLAILPFGTGHGDRHITTDTASFIELPFHTFMNDAPIYGIQVESGCSFAVLQAGSELTESFRISVPGGDQFNPTDAYARVTDDAYVETTVAGILDEEFNTPFTPRGTLIATWVDEKTVCPSVDTQSVRHSTIQYVLTSDGYHTYALYFGDDNCEADDSTDQLRTAIGSRRKRSMVTQMSPSPGTLTSDTRFYYLKNGSPSSNSQCLHLTGSGASLHTCGDLTMYRIHRINDTERYELFKTGGCLDKTSCTVSDTTIREADCDHCGALHWALYPDGTMREGGTNCIYMDATYIPKIHDASLGGCMYFSLVEIGDLVQFYTPYHARCLSGDIFESCSTAAMYRIYGLPRSYRLVKYETDQCLDRVDCEATPSTARHYSCDHCGADGWSYERYTLGQDDMASCVDQDTDGRTVMTNCSIYESLYHRIVKAASTTTPEPSTTREPTTTPKPSTTPEQRTTPETTATLGPITTLPTTLTTESAAPPSPLSGCLIVACLYFALFISLTIY